MLHRVPDTGLVVRNPETHHSLDPHDVSQLFKDLSWSASAEGIDYVSFTDFLVFLHAFS